MLRILHIASCTLQEQPAWAASTDLETGTGGIRASGRAWVFPAHRGRRLGVWMKAANLEWLAADHPQVTRVVTSTAADNEYMLAVNRQVGFSLDAATENWEADVAGLLARLPG